MTCLSLPGKFRSYTMPSYLVSSKNVLHDHLMLMRLPMKGNSLVSKISVLILETEVYLVL